MSCPSIWRFSTKEELMKKKIITAIAAVLVILAIAAAGFFGGIRYVKVQNEKKKPTVDTVSLTEKLAEISELASVEYSYTSMQATDETYSFFNRIDITDYTSFTTDQNSKMEKKALEAGLLQKARENAILTVREFIITSNPGFSVVVI